MPVRNSINNQSTGFTVNGPTSGAALTVYSTIADSVVVTQQSFGGAPTLSCVQLSNDAQPVYFRNFKRYTTGTITANDVIWQLEAYGQSGSVDRLAAMQRIYSTNVAAGYVSGGMDWFTTSTAGALGQRMILDQDGRVSINTPAAAGTALTVNGFNAAGTYGAQFLGVVPGAQFDAFRAINNTTTAGSSCQIECSVALQAGATGGDASLRFVNYGVRAIALGIDTSTDQFVIANSSALGLGNFFTFTASNSQINLPLQCAFHAYVNATIANVTGNGTNYQIVFNTETFDQGSNYNNATGLFTAPATGRYAFTYSLYLTGLVNHGQYFTQLVTTSLTYTLSDIQPNANILTFATNLSVTNPTIFVAMTAGDTAFVRINVNGGTNTQVVDIFGAINDPRSNFSGYLIC